MKTTKSPKRTRPKDGSQAAKTLWLRLDWPLLPGCISKAYSRCGKSGCPCKAKPPKLHGPYYRWTGLVAGKPTTITLDVTEAGECRRRIKRFHRLQKRLRQWIAQAMRCAPWKQRED